MTGKPEGIVARIKRKLGENYQLLQACSLQFQRGRVRMAQFWSDTCVARVNCTMHSRLVVGAHMYA